MTPAAFDPRRPRVARDELHSLSPALPGPAMSGSPTWLDEYVLSADARAKGLDSQVRKLIRAGKLYPVAHGVARWSQAAVDARSSGEHPRDDAYRARVRGSMLVAPEGARVAGASAALLWGMSLLAPWPERAVHAMPIGRDAHSSKWVERFAADCGVGRIIDGMHVTTPSRTVVDVARQLDRRSAFCLAATALFEPRMGQPLTRLDDVLAELERIGPVRGVRAARALVSTAGTGCESAAEALSLLMMLDAGFERPRQQVEFRDGEGSLFVDNYWESVGLVGECDGRAKYLRDDAGDGRHAAAVVVQEKRREDRLRALGLRVVRWTTESLRDARAFAVLLTTAGVPRGRRLARGERG